MANGAVIQFAVLSVIAAIALCLFIVYMRRKVDHERSRNTLPPARPMQPMPIGTVSKAPEPERQAPRMIPMEAAVTSGGVAGSAENVSTFSEDLKPPVVVQAQAISKPENLNQRILAGISENIRKSSIKPVSTYSPIQYAETPRETEYVRVKKKILTPHGQIRFSILKDSVSTNMLAIFRRACMDWKTPNDLVAFLPPYLEAEAEIFQNQLLLIGTPGHDEKLAIPIRSADLDSRILDCFDFVTDDRTAANTPAVLRTSDDDFEVVSRGVITQPVFLNPERNYTDIKLLVGKSTEALQNA